MTASIYLDHNATTPIDPRVVDAIERAWKEGGANPASQHGPGRTARRMLEEAREGIAELLGAKTGGMDADQVIFTSGGTEANNLALFGLAGPPGSRVFVSTGEHPSVLAASDELRRRGWAVQRVRLLPDGVFAVLALRGLLAEGASLVSLLLASNETGIIQPVHEVAAYCRERQTAIHTDAAQAVGKMDVSFRELGVDAMTIAPHKFHGPLGIGALVLRHGAQLQPHMFGGFQQGGLRPGTENVALAVGFHEALRLAWTDAAERQERMRSLRDKLERLLRAELPQVVVIGERAPRLPNTSCIAFPGVNRQALVMALDMSGVACSTGSACASGSSQPSPTLIAMNLPREVIEGSIRLSFGAFTTTGEVADAARRIINTVKHLQRAKSA